MATIVIKDSHMKFNGVKYFRGQAEEILLGSYGEKRKPIGKTNYLEEKDRISPKKFKIKNATIVDVSISKKAKGSVGATGSGVIKGITLKGKVGITYEKLRNDKLKLVKFSVANNDMEDAVNKTRDVRDDLRHYGNKARVAHQIFVAMEADLAEIITSGTSFSISAAAGKGIKLTAKGGLAKSRGTTITLSPGTTFAYLLLKPDWDRKKKKVIDMDDDQWGTS